MVYQKVPRCAFYPSCYFHRNRVPLTIAVCFYSLTSIQNFRVEFHKNEPYDASFSLIGIDASIANAFRRILIAEVPTLAIEYVYINNNTSIVQDEVLAHRLGLVPLTADTNGLYWMKWRPRPLSVDHEPQDTDTVVFKLEIECTKNKNAKADETHPLKKYHNAHVYARDMVYCPSGRQDQHFCEPDGVPRPVNPDILLVKMRPGQALDIEMHCIIGKGADHTKFSPVATASYRLLPTIDIIKPILGNDARKFARCFPKGVIGLEDVTTEESEKEGSGYEGHAGEQKAVVRNAFKDTVSRECLRHEEFNGKVKLGRVRDHFIFMVESTGQFESDLLFLESVKLLKTRAGRLKNSLANLMR